MILWPYGWDIATEDVNQSYCVYLCKVADIYPICLPELQHMSLMGALWSLQSTFETVSSTSIYNFFISSFAFFIFSSTCFLRNHWT